MTDDDTQQKARPVVVRKKSDGWREREEAKAARVAPHALQFDKGDDSAAPALVRC